MVSSRTYLTGSLGSRHRDEAFGDAFELPPDRAYGETCAAIGSVMLAWRLLLATGEKRYADLIERTAFNAVLPGLAFDGTHFFYSNPLMRRSSGAEILSEGAATTRRAAWFPVACCPPNLMRFLATFPDLVATFSVTGIQIHQFATASFEAPIHGASVGVSTRTDYPWDGAVEIAIGQSVAEPWTLSLRVPEWCSVAVACLGSQNLAESGPGTIELTRVWSAGDRLLLDLSMPARATLPDPRIDAVRGTIALERGPLVYAVEDADLPADTSVESLEVPAAPELETSVVADPQLGHLTWLSLDARLRQDTKSARWPYRHLQRESGANSPTKSTRIRALPYFAWGNRAGLGMRIWLPTRSPKGDERSVGIQFGSDHS